MALESMGSEAQLSKLKPLLTLSCSVTLPRYLAFLYFIIYKMAAMTISTFYDFCGD